MDIEDKLGKMVYELSLLLSSSFFYLFLNSSSMFIMMLSLFYLCGISLSPDTFVVLIIELISALTLCLFAVMLTAELLDGKLEKGLFMN